MAQLLASGAGTTVAFSESECPGNSVAQMTGQYFEILLDSYTYVFIPYLINPLHFHIKQVESMPVLIIIIEIYSRENSRNHLKLLTLRGLV